MKVCVLHTLVLKYTVLHAKYTVLHIIDICMTLIILALYTRTSRTTVNVKRSSE